MSNIIFIDNFDSFTYNLVDQLRILNHRVTVYRNNVDPLFVEELSHKLTDSILVLSPGPGEPRAAGNLLEIIKRLKGIIPIVGICLGHQAIIQSYGGSVEPADEIIHGKTSQLFHNKHPIFENISSPMIIARYHSLVGTEIPSSLKVIASANHLVMSVINEQDKVCGFQFHPESIMTTYGTHLFSNTINYFLGNKGGAK